MRTILAVTDFSTRAAVALDRAAAVAKATGAALHIAHAVDDDLPPAILDRRLAEAAEFIAIEAERLDGAPHLERHVVSGDVYRALATLAGDLGADLVVTGDHRRSPLRDIFRDTTVERLVRIGTVPVLIVRGSGTAPWRHALVGVEGEEAGAILATLRSFGASAPALATVLHAIDDPTLGAMMYGGIEDATIDRYLAAVARKVRERLADAIRPDGMVVEVRTMEGLPAECLMGFARQNGCDLVAVATHAHSNAVRVVLGSVSSQLIREGTVDLLIVPRRGAIGTSFSLTEL